jgi:dynein heavy chain
LELIAFYKDLLGKKRGQIEDNIFRLDNGLETIKQVKGQVEQLQEVLKVKMVDVEDKKEKTEALIDQVTQESTKAEAEQAIANEQEAKTNALANEAAKTASEAQTAADEARPVLIEAQEAVNCIGKKDLGELKALGQPPPLVQYTAKAVLILVSNNKIPGNEPIEKTWKRATQEMNDPAKFLNRLVDYDGRNIEESKLNGVKAMIEDPNNQKFDFNIVFKKNQAAGYLAKWMTSMVKYNEVYKFVNPLEMAAAEANETVRVKQEELAVVKARVQDITDMVEGLRRKLDEAISEKTAVENEAQELQDKLTAAEKLVNGLSGENARWERDVVRLRENTLSIIGDVLLASAFVSYIGPFSAPFREDLWKNQWKPMISNLAIPGSEDVNALQILTTESAMANWKNENLPADQMSLENATIITSCSRWPLMIDPQLQGSNWIRYRNSGGENFKVISLAENKWMQTLVNAVQNGLTVMIENLGQELDATLDPLLSRETIKRSGTLYIKMGGEEQEYHPNFQLYLQTKLSSPHYRPEVAAQCTIIYFIVTEKGLEDQLLATVVNIEKAELEQEKSELVRKQNEFQVKLAELDDELLNKLSEADPSTILENKPLIAKLEQTKATSNEIAIQKEKAITTELIINQQREFYRKVAAEGSTLYFLCDSLCFIDHMYRYSLETFTSFFLKAIERTTTQDENRIEDLRKNIRFTIYQWVARGLFERHKLIFQSLITFRLMQKKVVDANYEPLEMLFLLQAPIKPNVESPLDWLPTEAWARVCSLINLDEFKNFGQNLEKDAPSRFKDWYNELNPEDCKLPLDWKKLDAMPFKKLLVLRCLRPDRLITATSNFIRDTLPDGQEFVELDSKNSFLQILSGSYDDSTNITPIFFILSPGTDPVIDVEKLAKKKGFEVGKTFFQIALGQG